MQSKGYTVVSKDKRAKFIIRDLADNKEYTCIICHDTISTDIVLQQNGCSNTCRVYFHNECRPKSGDIHFNKCILCRENFHMFKNEQKQKINDPEI